MLMDLSIESLEGFNLLAILLLVSVLELLDSKQAPCNINLTKQSYG